MRGKPGSAIPRVKGKRGGRKPDSPEIKREKEIRRMLEGYLDFHREPPDSDREPILDSSMMYVQRLFDFADLMHDIKLRNEARRTAGLIK